MSELASFSPAAYGTCRGESCGSPVLWARVADGTGNLMPLDPLPDENGNVEIIGKTPLGRPHVRVHGTRPLLHEGPLYMPHHATCPDVEEFRK